MASYEDLYARWERETWPATAVDYGTDARHWHEELDEIQRSSALWNCGMFLHGVEALSRSLPATYDATLGTHQNLLVAAQLADEARHKVFLLRWLRDVAGVGDANIAVALDALEPHLTWGFRQVFAELERIAEALRKKPQDRGLLAQMVALSNILIEGMLAIPGQHFFHRYVQAREIMPGFSRGAAQVAKDVTRHVSFGLMLVKDLIDGSVECRRAVIDLCDRVLPWTVGVFVPPDRDGRYVECFDFTLVEVFASGLRSFESMVAHIGIEPSSIRLIRRDDRSLSYDERARRLLVLIDSGVVGDDRRHPELSPEAFEILFDAMARAIDIETARSLGGAIEWRFTDAEPWHIVVTDDHAEAKLGAAGEAALILEIPAADWALIAVGRRDARWALLTRRLKIHGSWPAKTKLPKLFD